MESLLFSITTTFFAEILTTNADVAQIKIILTLPENHNSQNQEINLLRNEYVQVKSNERRLCCPYAKEDDYTCSCIFC